MQNPTLGGHIRQCIPSHLYINLTLFLMSRLYYSAPQNGFKSLADGQNPPPLSNYLEKIAKLIPGEVIAAYLTMMGFVASIESGSTHTIVIWAVFGIGLIMTPLYLNAMADAGKPKAKHLVLSTLAFIVWAYSTCGEQLQETITPGTFLPAVASIILVAFTLVSGVIKL